MSRACHSIFSRSASSITIARTGDQTLKRNGRRIAPPPELRESRELEVLRDADPDETGIGGEYVGGQTGIIAVQEISGDRCRVEDVLGIKLDHQPTIFDQI